MNEETIELIDKFAEKLGTTAEHLWGVLVKQAPYSAVIQIVIWMTVAVLLMLALKWFLRQMRIPNNPDVDIGMCAAMIMCILMPIWIIIGICNASTVLSGIFNPEYWAIQQILP